MPPHRGGGTGLAAVLLKPLRLVLSCKAQCACSCGEGPWSFPTDYNTDDEPDMPLGARKEVPGEG